MGTVDSGASPVFVCRHAGHASTIALHLASRDRSPVTFLEGDDGPEAFVRLNRAEAVAAGLDLIALAMHDDNGLVVLR